MTDGKHLSLLMDTAGDPSLPCARVTPPAPRESVLTVAGRRLHATEWPGRTDVPALVLLHEGLGSVGLWRDFPDAIAEATGRRVIAFSRHGHGRSEPPPETRTPAFFHTEAHEILPAVLADLDAPEPLLVGHSDGGSIALLHAALSPVTGVVAIAPHVFVEEICVEAIRGVRSDFEGASDLRERMARHHDDVDAAFWGWCGVWLDPAFRAWSIEEDIEGVTAPTLVVQGDADPYGTLAQIDRVEARVRGPVERLVLPGGHSPHLEHPETVVAAIAEFAERVA